MNGSDRSNARRIAIASSNPGKLEEFRALLPPDITITVAAELGVELPEETGETFAQNALLKARAVASASGVTTIADDSGLEVDALGGAPGVHSARFAANAGLDHSDAENNRLLLKRLEDVSATERTARFRSVVAIVGPNGFEQTVEGVVEGRLLDRPRGDGGFGYDPLFIPDGFDRTMAEFSIEEKNQISHRGRAFRLAADVISRLLTTGGEVAESSECGTLTNGTDSARQHG